MGPGLMFSVSFEDDISPSLLAMDRLLANDRPILEEVGALMVTWVKEHHTAQQGMVTGMPYKALSPKYAKRKAAAGGSPARVLFGPSPGSAGAGGGLFASWKYTVLSSGTVMCHATGRLERVKASAHDGGLAQYLGKPELNRLQLGWTDKRLKQVIELWLQKIVDAGNKAPGA